MKVDPAPSPYDTINVTPMLDLAYVLLVVFILMTTASIEGLNISLPKPSARPENPPHALQLVQVAAGGALLLNGSGITAQELEVQLRRAQTRDAAVRVAVRGDDLASYAQVVAVIDLCDRLGLDVGLITSRIGT